MSKEIEINKDGYVEPAAKAATPVDKRYNSDIKASDDCFLEVTRNYWQERCLAAERFIEESPCDPDITKKQIEAHNNWKSIVKAATPAPVEQEGQEVMWREALNPFPVLYDRQDIVRLTKLYTIAKK